MVNEWQVITPPNMDGVLSFWNHDVFGDKRSMECEMRHAKQSEVESRLFLKFTVLGAIDVVIIVAIRFSTFFYSLLQTVQMRNLWGVC